MSSYSQLKNLAASLVDNVDQVIKHLEDGDQVLGELCQRHDLQLAKSKEFSERAAEHTTQADALAIDVADLKARLKYADTQMRTQKAYASSFKFKEAAAEKTSREVKTRIGLRREMLLRKEIDKRVNAIGKKIVQNRGHLRKGGGYDLIEDDGMLPGGRKNPNSLTNKLVQDNGPQE